MEEDKPQLVRITQKGHDFSAEIDGRKIDSNRIAGVHIDLHPDPNENTVHFDLYGQEEIDFEGEAKVRPHLKAITVVIDPHSVIEIIDREINNAHVAIYNAPEDKPAYKMVAEMTLAALEFMRGTLMLECAQPANPTPETIEVLAERFLTATRFVPNLKEEFFAVSKAIRTFINRMKNGKGQQTDAAAREASAGEHGAPPVEGQVEPGAESSE